MTSQISPLEVKDTDYRKWAITLVLVLILHYIILQLQAQWFTLPKRATVEVQEIDPQKLEAIKKQWAKSLLLNPNPTAPVQEKPDNARYESEKNIRVENEQRARISNVIPKAGRAGESAKQKSSSPSRPMIPLSQLGVPMKLALAPIQRPEQQKQNSGEDAADQAILDKNLREGNQNLLNAQESVYYSFYARIYEAIGPVWQSMIRNNQYRVRITPGEYTTQVTVILDREGFLIDVIRERSSGIDELDAIVEKAWRKLKHFPNPPAALINKDGQVLTSWTFRVVVNTSYDLNYLPPERAY